MVISRKYEMIRKYVYTKQPPIYHVSTRVGMFTIQSNEFRHRIILDAFSWYYHLRMTSLMETVRMLHRTERDYPQDSRRSLKVYNLEEWDMSDKLWYEVMDILYNEMEDVRTI